MNDAVRQLRLILEECEIVNKEVGSNLHSISVVEARMIIRACREAEGWLSGIRVILLGDDGGS